jgi:hypothetical protein
MSNKEQTREQMFAMIADWKQSGLSQKQYCQQHELRYHVFHYWYKRFKENQTSSSVGSFVPLTIHPSFSGHTEIYLPDGKRLIFHQPVSAGYLKALLD